MPTSSRWAAGFAVFVLLAAGGLADDPIAEVQLRADDATLQEADLEPGPPIAEAAEEPGDAESGDGAIDLDEDGAAEPAADPAPNPLGRLFRNLIGGRSSRSTTEGSTGFGKGRYALRDVVDARAPQDKEHTTRLRQAADLVAKEDWDTAERWIDRLLELPEGSLVRDEKGAWVSIHVETSRLLRRFPAEQFGAWRRKNAAAADSDLRAARRDGSPAKLGDVARRYFHTDAGYDAANELGSRHLDRGQFGIAARWFGLLIEADAPAARAPAWRLKAAYAFRLAGDVDRSDRIVLDLKEQGHAERIEIGGKRVVPQTWLASAVVPSEGNPSLDEWRMPYGNPSRTAVAAGGDPLLLQRWTQKLTHSQPLAEWIDTLHLDLSDARQPGISTSLPLLVGGRLIYRTLSGVRVVEAATGRTEWETRDASSPEELFGGPLAQQLAQMGFAQMGIRGSYQRFGNGPHPLARVLMDDGVSGLLASDGRRVFLIEEQAHVLQPYEYARWGGRWGGGWGGGWGEPEDAFGRGFETNRITAYDLRSGRPVWSAGGPLADELLDPPLAGNYFFGPPAIDGRLACLVGQKDERIMLYALDSATGLVEWSVWLGFSDTKIAQDFSRRSWAAQPAVARGIVVCPTTTGWLMAVDSTSRSVLWAQRFSKPNPAQDREDPEMRMFNVSAPNARWQPAAPVIVGDAVVFTPPEEQSVLCLGLYDGKVRWSAPRGENLYLAGVFDDRVLLVAGSRVTALSLKTGRSLWTVNVPQQAGLVSGRGVATAERFYLPLDSGQLWSIDWKSGTVADRWFLPENQPRLENLGLYQGMLISVGTAGATAFEQRDAIEKRVRDLAAQNPRNPRALLTRAEISLLERDHAAAIVALREIAADAVQAALRRRYRSAMIETLSALVRSSPAERQTELDELARFAREPGERLQSDRLRGLHLVAAGKHDEAFELYARLAEAGGERMVPRDDDPRVSVREDLWAAGELDDAWTRLDAAERDRWNDRIRGQAEQAAAAPRAAQEAFVLRYGFHPAALPVRSKLAEAAAAAGDFAAAAHELLALGRTADATVAPAALTRLARLMADAGAPGDAEHFRRVQAERFPRRESNGPPAPPPLPGEPNARIAAPGAHDVRDLAPGPDWGDFDLRFLRTGEQSYNVSHELVPNAFPSPFFRRHRFELHTAQQQLGIVDRLDESLHWLVPLRAADDAGGQSRPPSWVAGLRFAVFHGQVLHMLSPIDRRVLWTRNVSPGADGMEFGYEHGRAPEMQSGTSILGRRGPLAGLAAQGPVPVVNADYVALRERRELTVLDALTGRLRWRMGGLANGARILGYEQAVFVLPPDGAAVAYRARDGKPLRIPRLDQILAAMLASTPDGLVLVESQTQTRLLNAGARQTIVRLHDPLTGEDLWKRALAPDSHLDLLDGDELAIAGAEGHLDLLQLETGGFRRFENALGRQGAARRETVVAADDERVFLIVNRGGRSGNVYSEGIPHANANGTLIALDRATGEVAWRRTVSRQSMMLPHFRHMPVLLFAVRKFERTDEFHLMSCDLLAVDRRTGRTLVEESLPNNNGFQWISVNARDRHVEIGSYNERLRFMAIPRERPDSEPSPAGQP